MQRGAGGRGIEGGGCGGGAGARGGRRGGGLGAGGFCICLKCGHRSLHRPGAPCLDERCPECGAALVREGSFHHREITERRAGRATDEISARGGGASPPAGCAVSGPRRLAEPPRVD